MNSLSCCMLGTPLAALVYSDLPRCKGTCYRPLAIALCSKDSTPVSHGYQGNQIASVVCHQ
jgi:hypothetical protein